MKILRIRLLNLNSLRGEHVVDFEHGQLARSGLFLVCGPTGAGKSTLLDAVTLALYGRAARYAGEPNPEDTMTRLCGECQAEVEFEVASGRYRAEWHLRRAFGRPDGQVQPARRQVYDAQGQVLTQKIKEAEELIEKLVGLDYQRFLRSVLLAQGEFAQFLRAQAEERASLLESLTGTGIYGELSILAHEEATRREEALRQKEQDLARIPLLAPEQREELTKRMGERQAEHGRKRADLDRLNREAAQAEEVRRLGKQEGELLRERERSEGRARQAEPELARLARHRLALPYSEDLTRLDTASEQSATDQRELAGARQAQARKHSERTDTLTQAAEFAAAEVRKTRGELGRIEAEVQTAEARKRVAVEWLAAHEADRSLGADLPEIAAQLQGLESLRQQILKGRTRASALEKQAAEQAKKIEAAAKAKDSAEALLRQREGEKSAAGQGVEALLAGHTLAAREQELEGLRARAEALGKLALLAESARAKEVVVEETRKRLEEVGRAVEQAQVALVEARQKHEAAERALALRQDHLNQARLVASLHEHRAALKPGEACPLCGAKEHPYAEAKGPVFAESALEAELRRAREALNTAATTLRTAEKSATRLAADQAGLTRTFARDTEELAGIRTRAGALAAASSVEVSSFDRLASMADEVGRQVQSLAGTCARIREANDVLARAETARLRAEAESRLAVRHFSDAQATLGQIQHQAKEQTEANLDLERRLGTALDSLGPRLRPYQLASAESGHERAVLDALTSRRNAFQAQEGAGREAHAALEKAQQRAAQQKQAVVATEQRAGLLSVRVRELAGESLDTLPLFRAPKPPPWTSLEQAEVAVRTADDALSRAETILAQCQQAAERSAGAARKLTADLEERLAGSAFSELGVLRSARLTPEESARLERLQRQLESEASSLRVRFGEVQARLRELREAGAVEGPAVEELAACLREAQEATERLAGEIRLDAETLKRDQAERERQAALAEVLNRERAAVQLWQGLRGLMGSHDGRKFRRFAQGLSLDVLVDHANRHLGRLTDRYRMRRLGGEELDLEIEDLYQAGVTRPMASLSGGESFLASLALALGLAALAGRNVRIDSLFIDEGFGSLDSDTLDTAISALESLHQDAKTVGIVSHVDLLKERITTQILVERGAAGASSLRIVA